MAAEHPDHCLLGLGRTLAGRGCGRDRSINFLVSVIGHLAAGGIALPGRSNARGGQKE